jgi:hypothetical protein
MRERLVRLLEEETDACPTSIGSTADVILALFERRTGEQFTTTPGVTVGSRLRSLAKVLGNVTREAGQGFTPPLLSGDKVGPRGAYRVWNRAPLVHMDVELWRQAEERRDALGPRVLRVEDDMEIVDRGLASWLRDQRFLRTCDVEHGEGSMALLILWEVQHGRTFPAAVDGDNTAARLASFSRRLRDRASRDDVLSADLVVREMQFPLAPALPASHQLRWSVQVRCPEDGTSTEWYDEFKERWLAYLRELAMSARSRPAIEAAEERPRKRARAPSPPVREAGPRAADQGGGRRAATVRGRSPDRGPELSAKRMRQDLRRWLQPRGSTATTADIMDATGGAEVAVSSGHGQATSGAAT